MIRTLFALTLHSRPAALSVLSALPALLALTSLALAPVPAEAQWKWRDTQGRLVYSDVPPPPSIPAARIVHAPGGRAAGPLESLPDAPPKPTPAAATQVPPGNAATRLPPAAPALTPEQAFQKRHEERLKAEAAERERNAEKQVRDARCARLRGYVNALESGLRASRTKPDGSIEFLDDAARAQELNQAREVATRECSPAS